MARKIKRAPKRTSLPGYEPARGFPDPKHQAALAKAAAESPQVGPGDVTHMPHRNGTVCGRAITQARLYTTDRPTCTDCAKYFDSVNKVRRASASA